VRRIGLMHGSAECCLPVHSHRRNSRALGRTLSALGYAVATAAARLGGNIVYRQRVGVDHTAGQSFPDDFVPVLDESELREGTLRRVEYRGTPILLAKRGNHIFALAETCSHLGALCPKASSSMAPLNVPATDPVLLWRTDAYWTGPQFTRSPAWGRAHEMGQIEARKAIGSRSVGGTASVPAIREALVPAQQGCREGRVGGVSWPPSPSPPMRHLHFILI
jgi:hypothetical protein